MQDTIEQILERVALAKKDGFTRTLNQSIVVSTDSGKRTEATHDNCTFKVHLFFDGLAKALNETPKINRMLAGVDILEIVLEELGFDSEREDAFLIYQLKDLGKFRITDKKFKDQMNALWGEHKDFILTDQEYSHTLKVLMRMGIIDYRRGNLSLKKEMLIRYKG